MCTKCIVFSNSTKFAGRAHVHILPFIVIDIYLLCILQCIEIRIFELLIADNIFLRHGPDLNHVLRHPGYHFHVFIQTLVNFQVKLQKIYNLTLHHYILAFS